MAFVDLLGKIESVAKSHSFAQASLDMLEFVDHNRNFPDLLNQIGTIPESIQHDSTEEKLFSKVSDAILSRAFREIGLKSIVLTERADSADVIAESPIHGYTLVADAKAFRMSRTAKNQKDFKVTALSGWRKDNDYAVLCSPYFHYPITKSQIYAQAVFENVCLLSWEHLSFMILNRVKESDDINLSPLWNYSFTHSKICPVEQRKKRFIENLCHEMADIAKLDEEKFNKYLETQIPMIKIRGGHEKEYWKEEIKKIKEYTREQAIEELIHSKKIKQKIRIIDSYIKGLRVC